ncbi:MAG: TlpA disulfide reductase family protein, partial [Flavobacteriales bacterium]
YQVGFTIEERTVESAFNSITREENYDVDFSPGTADSSRAIGSFHVKNGVVQGTFMTESGDYRFLGGEWKNDSMYVSCFDGAHLFYFSASIDENRLYNGVFISGNHWRETWEGVASPTAQLQDPDAITTLRDTSAAFTFTVRAMTGDVVTFDSSRFANHVTIVQLFGSWCPNCTDESKLFKELYEEYKTKGLQIIPVAFERLDDITVAKKTIESQFQEIGITYPAYFGGKSSKEHAASIFSQLSSVSSYPTSLFIDHRGRVQKIHTGFYGPGTGNAYNIHRERIHACVDHLIQESQIH